MGIVAPAEDLAAAQQRAGVRPAGRDGQRGGCRERARRQGTVVYMNL